MNLQQLVGRILTPKLVDDLLQFHDVVVLADQRLDLVFHLACDDGSLHQLVSGLERQLLRPGNDLGVQLAHVHVKHQQVV